jgi:hypothetical protein
MSDKKFGIGEFRDLGIWIEELRNWEWGSEIRK